MFKLTYFKHIEIIKVFEFPAAYLPICFSSNYASVCHALQSAQVALNMFVHKMKSHLPVESSASDFTLSFTPLCLQVNDVQQ